MTHAVKARIRLTPADRRAQLLACAVGALAEHGVARATLAHVAARAGVSVAAVHAYFRTRDDLVRATLDRVATDLLAITVKAAAGSADVRTALRQIAGDFDRAACTTPDTVKVWLDWSTGFRADVWRRYLAMEACVLSDIGCVLRRGQRAGTLSAQLDVGAAARLFAGGGRTVALARFAGLSDTEVATVITYLVDGIVRNEPPCTSPF